MIILLFLAGIGAIAAIAVVGVYQALATGLPPASDLTTITQIEESIIYDRTGKTELARFGDERREVVTFEEIPPILLDATTAIEDKTFWDNAGFDPMAIISAGVDSLRGNSRGASTITQQLVRARLLPDELVQDPNRTVERKLKEIIQSIRVTQAFQGEAGKQRIITAYLNQNYYGNQSYGVKAAVESYFGKPLADITPAEAAIIASLPKSPSNYDLVRNAIEQCKTVVAEDDECPEADLVVPDDTTIVQRRNQVLALLAEGRTPRSRSTYTAAQFRAAEGDEVLLASQVTPQWLAPHFVWAVRDELTERLCGVDGTTCPQLERGGLRITTTIDLRLQKIAEKWVEASTLAPHRKDQAAAAKALGFDDYPAWMRNLENKNIRNGALVALDYQTGELVAYVGSAKYYATRSRPEFQPQYDVVGKGYRQPGSAFKPFNYAVGIDDGTLTAGTMLMDTATDFGGGYAPNDADNLERGPVRVRTALQFSLNIPSVKAMAVNKPDHVFDRAKDFGMVFQSEKTDAGLALALGVAEVRPVDLVTAYGTLANGGKRVAHTTILTITDRNGTPVDSYVPPAAVEVIKPQTAYIVTDMLAGNTNPNVNPFWGKFSLRGKDARRPATLKTGTNNDAKDLNAYGYIAPPTEEGRADGAYALAVGVWNGNSDNTPVSTAARPVFSIDVSTFVWQGFLQEASRKWPVTRFARPDGLTRTEIDPWTGAKASGGGESVNEWFIAGSEPKDALPRGHLRHRRPGGGAGGDRDQVRALDGGRPELDPARGTWSGHRRRPEPDARGVLLQRVVPAVRLLVGTGRQWRDLRVSEPVAVLYPDPDPGRQWRDPDLRAAVAIGLRGGRVAVPAGVPVGVAIGQQPAIGRAHTDTHRGADPDAHRRADPDADRRADPDGRAHAEPRDADTRSIGVRGTPGAVAGSGSDTLASVIVDIGGLVVRRSGRTILGPLDWQVRAGERWVVIGPNGSGKTTLLAVAGSDPVADRRDSRGARRPLREGRRPHRPAAHRFRGECRRGRAAPRPPTGRSGHDRAQRGHRAVVARVLGRRPLPRPGRPGPRRDDVRRRPAVRDDVGRRAAARLDRPRADAGPGPAPAR